MDMTKADQQVPARGQNGTWIEVLTSFGGHIAHLGYFRHEFVVRRGWLDEQAYADLVALCQLLLGPASSQVGIGSDFASKNKSLMRMGN